LVTQGTGQSRVNTHHYANPAIGPNSSNINFSTLNAEATSPGPRSGSTHGGRAVKLTQGGI